MLGWEIAKIRMVATLINGAANLVRYNNQAMGFAKRLEKAIIESGKPMKQIARELGVSPSHLSDLKNGKKKPRPSMYRRLADYFGFDLTELVLGGVEQVGTGDVPWIAQRAADALAHMVAEVNELDSEAKRLRGEIVGLRGERDGIREEIATLRAGRQREG